MRRDADVRSLLLALVTVAFLLPSLSAAACQERLAQSFTTQGIVPEKCVCGDALKNLKATLSPQFTLIAACNLYWRKYTDEGDVPINLRKTKLTLDEYTNGDRPWGQLLLKGAVRPSRNSANR